ncbi:MAG: CPBP family intramembrane metalloprotease [Chitinophagaceae bacterium]|nr:CPBP family intramembrane metalloprotease [Chitinophagaceae bacterium]
MDSRYLNTILQWPLKAFVTAVGIVLFWLVTHNNKPVAGLTAKNFNARPYFILLLLMLPLLLIAGQGADFQKIYPKLQMASGHLSCLQTLFFEACYGLDFFTIELFFRGFIILAFIKYTGKDAILPMAVFYCTIHFGKPVAECISSYFGGLILGAVVYNTKSIWGGLIIHLGIAWMMEGVGLLY